MLVFVIIFNLLLTLFNLYLLRCVWRWRNRLCQTAFILEQVERDIHYILSPAPEQIVQVEEGVMTLTQLYLQWSVYLKRFRQVTAILSVTLTLWRNVKRV
ncbi:MAG: hypothetical protein AB4041_21280 [Microcystaceae cyanobacterium]